MEILLAAIGNFITNHWFLTFLILVSNPIRLFTFNIQKKIKENSKKDEKDEM